MLERPARDLDLAIRRTIDHIVERRLHISDEILEALPLRGQSQEDEAAIALHMRHLHHGRVGVLGIEIVRIAVIEWHGFQPSVEVIGPAVIATLEFIGAARVVGDDYRAAMGTLVMQRANLTVLSPHDDKRLARDTRTEIVAVMLDLTLVSDVRPGRTENARHFQFKDSRVGVNSPMHTARLHHPGQHLLRLIGIHLHAELPVEGESGPANNNEAFLGIAERKTIPYSID